MSQRTQTDSIETSAERAAAIAFLADARNLPRWAPGFADTVEPAGTDWQVTKDSRQFTISVEVDEQAGTVDYVREIAPGQRGGAYSRTTPRPGGGCVITLTLPVPPGSTPEDVAAVLAVELPAVVALIG